MVVTRRNLIGERFGLLVVVEQSDDYIVPCNGKHYPRWKCKCDCGAYHNVNGAALTSGKTKSCGCLHDKLAGDRKTKHGETNTRLYRVWRAMRQRCYDKNNKRFNDYGGRGINVCCQWKDDFAAFRDWAMLNGYEPESKFGECTLDRLNVDGDYTPENCRFISIQSQQSNKRETIYVTYQGQTITLLNLVGISNLPYSTVYWRIKNGYSVEEAIQYPQCQGRARKHNG